MLHGVQRHIQEQTAVYLDQLQTFTTDQAMSGNVIAGIMVQNLPARYRILLTQQTLAANKTRAILHVV